MDWCIDVYLFTNIKVTLFVGGCSYIFPFDQCGLRVTQTGGKRAVTGPLALIDKRR